MLKNYVCKAKKIICTSDFVYDGLFLLGVSILIATNFVVNVVFGAYSVALFLVALSIYLSNTKKK